MSDLNSLLSRPLVSHDHTAATAHTYAVARTKMEEYLEGAKARAEGSIRRIMEEVPKDVVLPGTSVEFRALLDKPATHLGIEMARPFVASPHDNFLQQFASDTGIGMTYVRHLQSVGQPWARELLAETLTKHAHEVVRDERHLVRGISGNGKPGQVRAWLSSKFRRIDCQPGLMAVIEQAQKVGAYVTDAVVSDIRASVRVLMPRLYDIGGGEYVCVGIAWSNSDYGRGAQEVSFFLLRLWCLNGAKMETVVRQVHLGARLSDDVSYSERTRRLDAAATSSAMRDTVRELLTPDAADKVTDAIRAAHASRLDPKQAVADLKKRIGKGLSDRVVGAYNGPDVEELPAGNTKWRWSNAISWVAKQKDVSADDRLDLEREAGNVLR